MDFRVLERGVNSVGNTWYLQQIAAGREDSSCIIPMAING
jgi:hypothetical protein